MSQNVIKNKTYEMRYFIYVQKKLFFYICMKKITIFLICRFIYEMIIKYSFKLS